MPTYMTLLQKRENKSIWLMLFFCLCWRNDGPVLHSHANSLVCWLHVLWTRTVAFVLNRTVAFV